MSIQSIVLFDGNVASDYSYDFTNPIATHDIGHVAECWLLYESKVLTDGSVPPISECVGMVSLDNATWFLVAITPSGPAQQAQAILVEQHAGDPNSTIQALGLARYIQIAPQLQGPTVPVYFKATLYYTVDTGLFAMP